MFSHWPNNLAAFCSSRYFSGGPLFGWNRTLSIKICNVQYSLCRLSLLDLLVSCYSAIEETVLHRGVGPDSVKWRCPSLAHVTDLSLIEPKKIRKSGEKTCGPLFKVFSSCGEDAASTRGPHVNSISQRCTATYCPQITAQFQNIQYLQYCCS